MSSDTPAREELPEIDMAAVYAERAKIAAAAFPNDQGNYRRRVKVPPAPLTRITALTRIAAEDLSEEAYAERRRNRPKHTLAAAALLVAAAFGAGGCASTADVIRDLGDDHASLKVEVVTPWGTQRLTRINPAPGQSVRITPDGAVEATGIAPAAPPAPPPAPPRPTRPGE